jgi:hypothetical protein
LFGIDVTPRRPAQVSPGQRTTGSIEECERRALRVAGRRIIVDRDESSSLTNPDSDLRLVHVMLGPGPVRSRGVHEED